MITMVSLAQVAPVGQGAPGLLEALFPILLILPVFYFLIIRPKNKQIRLQNEKIGNIKRGDTIVTQGGLIGKVVKIKDDNELEVEIAAGVIVRVIQTTIVDVRLKNPAVKQDKPTKKD